MPNVATPVPRPGDDDVVPILDALRWQHAYVTAAGSPTAALILDSVIEDIASGGVLAGLVPVRQRFGDLPGLRVMAAVHRLALERRIPAVAVCLPTLGGTPPTTDGAASAFRRSVVESLRAHPRELADSLARTPQTNETGRAALLRAALSREDPSRPVRLREIGASAGLNLRADHLPGVATLEAGPLPSIIDRLGCDLDPVDIGTLEGRALLGSYIWVDDVDRFTRLARAMEIAGRVPATVLRMDAVDFVGSLTPEAGTTTVLWDSAMWVYLPADVQRSVLAAVSRCGAQADADRPFVHVSWEWAGMGEPHADFALVTRRWDGGADDGRPRLLATGMSHGGAVSLTPPDSWLDVDPLVSSAG